MNIKILIEIRKRLQLLKGIKIISVIVLLATTNHLTHLLKNYGFFSNSMKKLIKSC